MLDEEVLDVEEVDLAIVVDVVARAAVEVTDDVDAPFSALVVLVDAESFTPLSAVFGVEVVLGAASVVEPHPATPSSAVKASGTASRRRGATAIALTDFAQ